MKKKEVNRNRNIPIFLLIAVIILVLLLAKFINVKSQKQSAVTQPIKLEILQQAAADYQKGNYVAAIKEYKAIINSDAENYGAYIGLGNSYLQLGIFDEAIKTFEKTKSLKSFDYRTYLGLGLTYYTKEDYNNAYENLKQAYHLNPTNKAVISYLLSTYNAVGLYDETIKLAGDKLTTEPKNSHYYRKIAIAYFLKNDLSKSLEAIKKTVQINDTYTPNHLTYGTISLGLQEKETALNEFKKAQQLSKQLTVEGLSTAYYLSGDAENSKRFSELESLYPRHSNTISLLGFALLDAKDYGKAIEEFNLAIATAPNYYLPYKGLGKVYMELGQRENAIKNFEKASTLNNLDPEIVKLLEEAKK